MRCDNAKKQFVHCLVHVLKDVVRVTVRNSRDIFESLQIILQIFVYGGLPSYTVLQRDIEDVLKSVMGRYLDRF